MGVLHVLHKSLAAEEEFVADRAAGCVRAADQSGVLLEHNTLLQLLFCGGRKKKRPEAGTRGAPGREQPTHRIPPQSVANQKRRTGSAQNRTIDQ